MPATTRLFVYAVCHKLQLAICSTQQDLSFNFKDHLKTFTVHYSYFVVSKVFPGLDIVQSP